MCRKFDGTSFYKQPINLHILFVNNKDRNCKIGNNNNNLIVKHNNKFI